MTTATDLMAALTRYQDARPALRDAMHASALALSVRLASERDTLLQRLDKRWDWCWTNVDNSQFAQREEALLADLTTYEAIEDALRRALEILFPVAA
jgi:hypothetical protein